MIAVLITYIKAYSWVKDDFDFVDLAKLPKVYGNSLLIGSVFCNAFLLFIYRVKNLKSRITPWHWTLQVLLGSFFTLALTMLLDFTIYYIDPTISEKYMSTLKFMVETQQIKDPGFIMKGGFPLFWQHLVYNSVMLFAGQLIGVLTSIFMTSKKDFS